MLGESYSDYLFEEEEEEEGREREKRTLKKLDTDVILRSSLAYTLTITVISATPISLDVLPALNSRLLPTVNFDVGTTALCGDGQGRLAR